MCGLYGFFNYSGQNIKNLSTLTNCLAEQAAVRGTDATGIAYNDNGKLVIHKEPKSAYALNLKHPDNIVCVTGHTRHATQGNKKQNYNNHPFGSSCKNLRFALCHNGILSNDVSLKKEYHLPKTKIGTDSYVAVQLLERIKKLNIDNVKFMVETVMGSFAFTILDSSDTLWLVRGNSPLSLIHLPNYKSLSVNKKYLSKYTKECI
ncbi:MAG: class II glutamine amidotransferase, partial [bacterium]|nr:class II glutamine amidotransferase [bacterium]